MKLIRSSDPLEATSRIERFAAKCSKMTRLRCRIGQPNYLLEPGRIFLIDLSNATTRVGPSSLLEQGIVKRLLVQMSNQVSHWPREHVARLYAPII